jgi:hypothetical protein
MGTNARDRASLGHRSTSVKRSSTARHARYLSSRFGSILAEPAPPPMGTRTRWFSADLALRQLLAERRRRSRQRLVSGCRALECGSGNLRAATLCGQWLHASGGEPDFAVTARSGVGVTLSASPSSLAAGASMTATWSDIAAPTATDWIGLYARRAWSFSADVALRQLLAERRRRSRQRFVPNCPARERGHGNLRAATLCGQRLQAPGDEQSIHDYERRR